MASGPTKMVSIPRTWVSTAMPFFSPADPAYTGSAGSTAAAVGLALAMGKTCQASPPRGERGCEADPAPPGTARPAEAGGAEGWAAEAAPAGWAALEPPGLGDDLVDNGVRLAAVLGRVDGVGHALLAQRLGDAFVAGQRRPVVHALGQRMHGGLDRKSTR